MCVRDLIKESRLCMKIPSDKSYIAKVSSDFLTFLHTNGIKECDAFQIAFDPNGRGFPILYHGIG